MIAKQTIRIHDKNVVLRVDLLILGRAFGKSIKEMEQIIKIFPDIYYAFSLTEEPLEQEGDA